MGASGSKNPHKPLHNASGSSVSRTQSSTHQGQEFRGAPKTVELGDASTMRHRHIQKSQTGIDATVSDFKSKTPYESVDYARNEDEDYKDKFIHSSKTVLLEHNKYRHRYTSWRWVFCGLIGACTAIAAFFIDFCVEHIETYKFDSLSHLMERCDGTSNNGTQGTCPYVVPIAVMSASNMMMVLIASVLCAYIAQCACGSGIPEIKCFLNGIRYPGWLSFQTMLVKVVGVLFSVGASMPVGKEGPMIHSGAIIGAGLPQYLKTNVGSEDFRYFFRNDRAKRDFVSAGAAAGVAAAFGAPIGGVLFSLEEGCSFWSQSLTWRVFFSSMCSLLVLDLLVSGITNSDKPGGGWGKIGSGGMISFGSFYHYEGETMWSIVDLGLFVLMGAVGGVLGGVWNGIQTRITKFRMRRKNFTRPWMVIEAVTVCMINSVIFMAAIKAGTCTTIEPMDKAADILEYRNLYCKDGEYNDMASLSYNTLEIAIRNLFHTKQTNFTPMTCFIYFICLYFTSCWTYGLMIPSGLFVPSLACGAAYGRLVAELFVQYGHMDVDRGVYALIGAAAFLGGVVRMTISLTVILIEATDQVMLSFPLMTTLIVAKWVGDHFNTGIYDIHIHLKKVPLLEFEAEHEMKRFVCKDIMSKPVKTFEVVSRLSDVVNMLRYCPHNGFPIVRTQSEPQDERGDVNRSVSISQPTPATLIPHNELLGSKGSNQQLRGMILRHQIITMLQRKCWGQRVGDGTTQPLIPFEAWNRSYPQRGTIAELEPSLPTDDEMAQLWIDFSHYINMNPLTVQPETTMNRAYVIFRGLGLRHLPVVDECNRVVGIITRKELTPHRLHELDHDLDEKRKKWGSFVSQASFQSEADIYED